VIYTIGPYLLPELVRNAITRTPQMPLMLQENFTVKLLEMLRTGEIDCAIMAEPFPDTGLAMARCTTSPSWPPCPARTRWRQKSVTATELKNETMLLLGAGHCFATMCWRSAPSSRALPATPRASASRSRARRWRPSNTWWPPAWA
jgi:LysR family hydrogen peroxide-inducible transcriptional activator